LLLLQLLELGRGREAPVTGAAGGVPVSPAGRRPSVAPWLARVELDDRIGLFGGDRLIELAGPDGLGAEVLDLLDGTRTEAEVLDAVDPLHRDAVRRALDALQLADALTEGRRLDPADGQPVAAAVALAGTQPIPPEPALVAARVAAASVAVVGCGRAAPLIRALLAADGVRGVRADHLVVTDLATAAPGYDARHPAVVPQDPIGEVDLVIAAPGPDELAELRDLGRRGHDAEQVWLPVLPFDGARAQVGPLVLPGRSACFECTQVRRAAAVEFTDDAARLFETAAAVAVPWFVDGLAASVAAAVALQWLGCKDPRLPGELRLVEAGQLTVAVERVLRVPRCPLCSPVATSGGAYPWFAP
jgi:bacteriocin biosynthesis cyclodehydratase domain-containing protein